MAPIDFSQTVAEKGVAPRAWQSSAPVECYLGRKPAITDSRELQRIIALPRREPPPADAVVAYMTQRLARENPRCECRERFNRDCIKELLYVQAWALYEMAVESGLLGPIGVGHGKTMIDLLAPLVVHGCRQALLLAPSNLMTQLATNYQHYSQHFYMPKIVIIGAQVFKSTDGPHIREGSPVLHVMPYSRLRLHTATAFIDTLKPDTIISDECHKLANADTATASRVMRYVDKKLGEGDPVHFIGLTGSLTYKSPQDYAHLSKMALGDNSPLPNDPQIVKEWSTAFDEKWPAPIGALQQLCNEGEHLYSGFQRRLLETSGVVATKESAIKAELRITEREAPEIPDDVQECLDMIRNENVRPDGEHLLDAFSVNRCAREMACGFYYYWHFPPIKGQPQKREHIDRWFEARKAWHAELRDKLKDRAEHLDSPFLCSLAAARFWGDMTITADVYDDEDDRTQLVKTGKSLPEWRAETWPAWRDIRHTVVYESRPQWVNDYLARDAAEWAKRTLGIVWYEHNAFGIRVAELADLPLHGGGPKAEQQIMKEKGDRSIIASIKSHGTGRDGLQFLYHKQLVANPMSNPTGWEQLLGRLFRIGQKQPTVYAEFYRHTKELRDHVDMAVKRAIYVQGTLGSSQKLLIGFGNR